MVSPVKPFYTLYEWYISKDLNFDDMPKHVAITMDGNRRYAKIQGNMTPMEGHNHGRNTLEKFLGWCSEFGIETVTVYAFSIKNFNRSPDEVEGLMHLFKENFEKIARNRKIQENEVRVKAVGQLDLFPKDVKEVINTAEISTASNKKMILYIAIGYDGRLEIVDALKKISKKVKEGKLNPEKINEEIVNENLYTTGLSDPNIVIRTSGEERLSGFLLWQTPYSELYFCDSLWPSFRKVDFLRALRSYQRRKKRV